MLICVHGDINEVLICMKLHEGSEPMQVFWHHVRDRFDNPLQLEIICMKDCVRLPLFSHITRVLEHGELCNERLEWLNVQEGRTFHHLPSGKCVEDQEPAKVELIALILSFGLV
jgi:hypothetical protein